MGRQRTIIVSGMIATVPHQGGATWSVLQYILGLRNLGHEVYFIESISPASVQPRGVALAGSENAAYFRRVAEAYGLSGCAALLKAGTHQTVGLPYEALREITARADAIINIAGMLTDDVLLERVPIRVYLDVDPGFTQLWHTQGIDMRFVGHTHFATLGEAIGAASCVVPTCGRTWLKTRPPVVLPSWPVATDAPTTALTTVAHWRGYGGIMADGVHYGQKAHSLRRFIATPILTPERLLLALAIHPGETRDLAALHAYGWEIVDPAVCARTPALYQQFIRESKGEFGLAKSGYVVSRCGWFSDRSVCYLASGRPVIAQETGFSQFIPSGTGLLSFATQDELLAQIEMVNRDYAAHAHAARALAESYFDAAIVLPRLLEQVGVET